MTDHDPVRFLATRLAESVFNVVGLDIELEANADLIEEFISVLSQYIEVETPNNPKGAA